MLNFLETLKGKKTYTTAIVAIAGIVGAYFHGDIGDYEALMGLFGAVVAIFLRDGITTEGNKNAK